MRKKSKERDREGEDEQESFEHVHTTAAASATMPEADTHYSKNVLCTFLTHIIFPSLSNLFSSHCYSITLSLLDSMHNENISSEKQAENVMGSLRKKNEFTVVVILKTYTTTFFLSLLFPFGIQNRIFHLSLGKKPAQIFITCRELHAHNLSCPVRTHSVVIAVHSKA